MTSKEKYDLLNKLGLCHRCEKAKVWQNRKFCPECLEKIAQDNAKRYDIVKAHEYQSRRRELYRQKKEKGICVRCTKKATHGLFCYDHSIEAKKHNIQTAKRRKIQRHERGLIPDYRIENSLCYRCGQPLDITGSKLCSVCTEQNREHSKLADKSIWRAYEQARYSQNKEWRKRHEIQN